MSLKDNWKVSLKVNDSLFQKAKLERFWHHRNNPYYRIFVIPLQSIYGSGFSPEVEKKKRTSCLARIKKNKNTPWKINGWNLQTDHSPIFDQKMIFQPSTSMRTWNPAVKIFRGCKPTFPPSPSSPSWHLWLHLCFQVVRRVGVTSLQKTLPGRTFFDLQTLMKMAARTSFVGLWGASMI